MVRTDFRQRGLPWVELLLDGGMDASALNLGWRHRASAAVSVWAAVSIVRGRKSAALGSLVTLAVLNAPLYDLIRRRRGLGEATLGVGLHAVHHVMGAAAAAVAVARHLRSP
jgi:hypothetical protein